MAELSSELLNMLTEFMICEIGSKALDGITYSMVLKNDSKREKELYRRYSMIKETAEKQGFGSNEIFRAYEVSNGYIFDMDLSTVKSITAEIVKSVSKTSGGEKNIGDLIQDKPEQRRKRDIIALAKYLKSEYDKGNMQCEAALFSRNSTNKIFISGKSSSGEMFAVRYNAYAIRHWDIELINERYLIPAGFRVKRIQPCEILPSKTGVSFIFTMESMDDFRTRFQ